MIDCSKWHIYIFIHAGTYLGFATPHFVLKHVVVVLGPFHQLPVASNVKVLEGGVVSDPVQLFRLEDNSVTVEDEGLHGGTRSDGTRRTLYDIQ